MLKYIIFSSISFMLGLFAKEIIDYWNRRKKYKVIKPLSEQDFEKAKETLEIR